MILIVGLGNYPSKYEETRHNYGFKAIDRLREKLAFPAFKMKKTFYGEISEELYRGNEKVILLKPHTLMNLSGKAVHAIRDFYNIPAEKIWVLHDDLDLEMGTFRVKQTSSGSGGQRGIQDIISKTGFDNFNRVKLGIHNGSWREYMSAADFVLGKFTENEKKEVSHTIDRSIEALVPYL